MKAIYGNLNMAKKYSLVDIECLDDIDFESCENCGKIIKNVAIVEDEEKNRYRIGLDCMDTIVNMIPSEKQEAHNRARRLRNFIKFLKKECKTIVINGDTCYFYKRDVEKWEIGYVYWCTINLFEKTTKNININGIKIIRKS